MVTAPNLNTLDPSHLIFRFAITFCSLRCICEQFSLCCARLLSLPAHLARTLSYHWTVNVALCGEKSTSVLSQVWANNLAFLQSALDSGVVPIRGASRRCRIFCGGDSPWLRRLSGVTTHWMAGSLFSYMTWCKSSATWLQQDVDRTTERDEQLLGLIAPGAKCRPMDIFGVVQSRLLKVPLRRRHLIPCVLHLLIFVGRQVTHCLGTQIGQVYASQY